MVLTLTFTCAAEAAVFWFSGAILRLLGPQRCLHLVFLAFAVRLGCYATLAAWGSPWKVGGRGGGGRGAAFSAGSHLAVSLPVAPLPAAPAASARIYQDPLYGLRAEDGCHIAASPSARQRPVHGT